MLKLLYTCIYIGEVYHFKLGIRRRNWLKGTGRLLALC